MLHNAYFRSTYIMTMSYLKRLCFIIFTSLFALNQATAEIPENTNQWNYVEQAKWPAKFCFEGKNQSPINIVTENTTLAKGKTLHLNGQFNKKVKAKLLNKDYTVVVHLDDASKPAEISGGGLSGRYAFIRFGFQWPSQHTIDNKRFPLEITMVFYAEKYGNAHSALYKKDGFAVISAFFEISEQPNPVFDPIIAKVQNISSKMNGAPVALDDDIVLKDFLPKNYETCFSYFGSSTMPRCEEMVTLCVVNGTSAISLSQYFALTKIKDSKNNPVLYNNRNIQPLNGRQVFRNQ
ncbi:carbonic anhydrase 2-like [Zophobas morio]|uniref:carbonic anhydrase 2-like n=1 Tax=Zophobas morio TaxID=2755281 RepID=UPI003082B7A0